MEHLFRLAERVTDHLNEELKANKQLTDFISFTESVITNTTVKILFSNGKKDKIVCYLSLHPLDMPWNFQIKINIDAAPEFELNKWKQEKAKDNEVAYEVYPNLLKDPEGKGDELAKQISADVMSVFKEIKLK
ncbi:hypothetical protein A4H97_32625 [Niastella yeongjuensis]|uniref:Uncharacterized protein n=1 Tax=Niastella yeongjuensis TaxID=354355 RepID=A0A1V9EH86_9BACT|nr:hypothetical protein [Niastella yeongjuensis]OQP45265.1 hypothetical protein A4H97_32625 [Niastella yeongjuensis]SEO27860.1 hypothetical protein SAMN05660816_02472 [Niastella yeongjuensis]